MLRFGRRPTDFLRPRPKSRFLFANATKKSISFCERDQKVDLLFCERDQNVDLFVANAAKKSILVCHHVKKVDFVCENQTEEVLQIDFLLPEQEARIYL